MKKCTECGGSGKYIRVNCNTLESQELDCPDCDGTGYEDSGSRVLGMRPRDLAAEKIAAIIALVRYAEQGDKFATRDELRMILADPMGYTEGYNYSMVIEKAARYALATGVLS